MTLIILEFQANNDGSCTMTPPLGYTDETRSEERRVGKECL